MKEKNDKKVKNPEQLKIVFFGTDDFSTNVLDEMKVAGFLPKAIVSAPDKPSGRGQKIKKPKSKLWAENNLIQIIQPVKLNSDFVNELKNISPDLFVVASYGKIIPKSVLDLPKHGSLNVHPSLLPFYRGASPIESAILDDTKSTGVTIMLVDEEMDHGPILGQEIVLFDEWPTKNEVEKKLARVGGELLSETISNFISSKTIPQEQDHEHATFTKKIDKEMGEINLNDDPRKNFLKIQALNPWPGAYFFIEHQNKKIRVKITEAKFNNDVENNEKLEILKVIPEGRKEITYSDFKRGFC